MNKTKIYDFSNNIIEFGFIEKEPLSTTVKLENIISSVDEYMVVVDTNNSFLASSLMEFSSFLNQSEKLFIGLVDSKTLNLLQDKGVKSGFIRSTDYPFGSSFIVVDKKDVYCVFDKSHIYQINNKEACKEIFDFVNHVIWAKANFELFQGDLKRVNENRLSW